MAVRIGHFFKEEKETLHEQCRHNRVRFHHQTQPEFRLEEVRWSDSVNHQIRIFEDTGLM